MTPDLDRFAINQITTRDWTLPEAVEGYARAGVKGIGVWTEYADAAGGKAAAIAYTLIETAKLNAVDPHAWLADTLARIPDYKITKVDDLLPWRWNG